MVVFLENHQADALLLVCAPLKHGEHGLSIARRGEGYKRQRRSGTILPPVVEDAYNGRLLSRLSHNSRLQLYATGLGLLMIAVALELVENKLLGLAYQSRAVAG